MPGRILLDTNIVIALFSAEQGVCQQVRQAEVLLSSTVLGELYYGALKSSQFSANLSRIDEFAASVEVLPCNAATARCYGQVKDRLRSRGRPIPDNDIWVAAVAMQHGLRVATRDEHFKEVDGLPLENW